MEAALAGVLAGFLHVVSGPDHLVAVAPLAMKRPVDGLRIGFIWGLGHASGVLVIGALGVLLRTFVEVQALSDIAELVVGFVLIGVGTWAIAQMRKVVVHEHPHRHLPQAIAAHSKAPSAQLTDAGIERHLAESHDTHGHLQARAQETEAPHVHLHVHTTGKPPRSEDLNPSRTTFWVGLIHGAAGTGHLLGVIPSLALPPPQGAVYLACYGFAAVAAMSGFGFTVGIVGKKLSPSGLRRFMLVSGLVAIALGLFWLQSALRSYSPGAS